MTPVPPSTDGKTLLLVDDNPAIRRVASQVLRRAGYDVIEAQDGMEAVELGHLHRPRLILMDMSMPVMDGLAATRALKGDAATRSIPILMLTGSDDPTARDQAFAAGCDSYLSKPFESAPFLALVAKWTGGPERAS